MKEDRDLLRLARVVGSFVLIFLIAFVTVADRLGPALSDGYSPIGDTAFLWLLGALFAMVGVQGYDIFKGRK